MLTSVKVTTKNGALLKNGNSQKIRVPNDWELETDELSNLAEDSLGVYAQRLGISKDSKVNVLIGGDSMIVVLEDGFKPAERHVARQPARANLLLKRAYEQLLKQATADVAARIEAKRRRQVASIDVTSSPETGRIMVLFELGEALPIDQISTRQ